VRDALPSTAQTIWRNIFNAVVGDGASEESAFRQAWGGLKNQGWEKNPDTGQWHKVEKVEKTRIEIPITKIDEAQNLVFGWANVSVGKDGEIITDLQDDQIDIDELEQAAYEFMLYFGESGVMHEGEAVGKVIESFVVTPEKLEKMGLPADALPIGWWFGAYIENDDVFQQVVKGEYSMFSIQGTAIREAA
jgi:cation transport regulator ChaB